MLTASEKLWLETRTLENFSYCFDWKFIENLPKSIRDVRMAATTCEEVQGTR